MPDPPDRRLPRVVLVLVVCAYLVAAYRPFAFDPPAYVRNGFHESGDGTYVFDGSSMVRTEAPPSWVSMAIAGNLVDVELEVLTGETEQDGPARLFTVSADASRRNLTIAQDGDDVVVRLRRPGSDPNGRPELVASSVFAERRWRAIAVRIDPERVVIEIDGQIVARERLGPAPLSGWDEAFRLALGNELDGDRGWSGRIRRAVVQVPGSSVDYVADGSTLVAPEGWWYVPARVLDLRIVASDVALNALGFIPFGVVYLLSRRGPRPVRRATAAAALLSLSMELGQVVVRSRDPSVVDLALNVMGGMVGAAVVVVVTRRASTASDLHTG